MAENPLLGFFESIGAGMEAGQRRRTLMQRARQGEAVDVPGLGMTALMGAVRAATPASTRLAQDQLQLQIANQALDQQIFEAKQQAAEAEKITLKTKAKKEAEAERDNSVLFADLLSRAESDLSVGKFDTLSTIKKEASALPVAQQVQLNSAIGDLTRTYDLQKGREYNNNKEILGQYLSPEDVNKLGPLQAETLVEIISGRYQSGIGQMVGDFNNLNALGLTNLSALVMPAIEKQARSVGQVIEMDPTTGQVTMREEIIGGPDKDLSATERSDLREASRSYQELKPILDKAERLVTESPEAFGSSGEWTGAINQLKSLAGVIPIAQFKQDMTRREVETTMDTLVGQVLPVLAGASLGRMTENDAKLLKAPLPKLDVFTPAEVVKQQIDALRFRVSLAYILGRESGGSLQGLLDEEGPVEFARLVSRAKSEGFGREERTLERAVDQAIRDIAAKPQAEADSELRAMMSELQRSGKFTKDELKSLILNNPALN